MATPFLQLFRPKTLVSSLIFTGLIFCVPPVSASFWFYCEVIYFHILTISYHLHCYRSGSSYHHLLPILLQKTPRWSPCFCSWLSTQQAQWSCWNTSQTMLLFCSEPFKAFAFLSKYKPESFQGPSRFYLIWPFVPSPVSVAPFPLDTLLSFCSSHMPSNHLSAFALTSPCLEYYFSDVSMVLPHLLKVYIQKSLQWGPL